MTGPEIQDLIERTARQTAKETVTETFTKLGVDVSTPQACIEAQRDFSFMRSMRQRAGLMVTSMVAGMVAMFGAIAQGAHMLDAYLRKAGG
jgi:hypothetical protein